MSGALLTHTDCSKMYTAIIRGGGCCRLHTGIEKATTTGGSFLIRKTDTVFKILGIVFLSLGGFFLLVSLIFLVIRLNSVELKPDDAMAFFILFLVFHRFYYLLHVKIHFAVLAVEVISGIVFKFDVIQRKPPFRIVEYA